jgi:peptidoglycan/xylan/chitin deacetylase (PgdA/CDA1 family)
MSRSTDKGVHVALTFDFDCCCAWIGSLGATSPSMVSRGEFGGIAVRRVLALLDKFGVKGTFFIPGHSALLFPDQTKMIRAAGHEIGHHGWVHENPTTLTPEQERQVLERGLEALDKVLRVRPLGYRSPAWDNSPMTVPLLLEYGFEYESSLMGGDYQPYWCRIGDEWSTTEEYRWGRPVDLVEAPVAWHLDDFPVFEYVWTKWGGVLQGNSPPSSVEEVWRGEFDYLYHRVGRGLLIVTMHPQVIGRGHRMAFLERFIRYMAGHPDVTFNSILDYVQEWRRGRSPELPADAGPARSRAWDGPAPKRQTVPPRHDQIEAAVDRTK